MGTVLDDAKAEERVLRTALLFKNHANDRGAIVRALEDDGYSNLEARKLYEFVQSAFAWALLKKMGVTKFPSELVFRAESGDFTVPVASQHEFTAALKIGVDTMVNGYTELVSREVFEAVIAGSAEVNVVNKALNDGSDLDGAEIRTVLYGFSRRDFGIAPQRR